jgi:hypothetical protein
MSILRNNGKIIAFEKIIWKSKKLTHTYMSTMTHADFVTVNH